MRRQPANAISPVPLAVRRYIQWSGADEAEAVRSVRVSHTGTFRLGLHGPWLNIEGQLDLETSPLRRQWTGMIRPLPFFWLRGTDSYINGTARLDVKLLSQYRVSSATGHETALSELVTILAELPFAPTALRPSETLKWSYAGSCSAQAILSDGPLTVSGIFHFAPDGRPLRFETADRFRQRGRSFVCTPWIVRYHDFRTVHTMQLPVDIEAAWIIRDREVSYARFRTTHLIVGHGRKTLTVSR
jgi:hypothetical protein